MNEEWKWLTDCYINLCLVEFCSDNVGERRRIVRMSWEIDACWLQRKLNGHMGDSALHATRLTRDVQKRSPNVSFQVIVEA
jgi:hypothetical protein